MSENTGKRRIEIVDRRERVEQGLVEEAGMAAATVAGPDTSGQEDAQQRLVPDEVFENEEPALIELAGPPAESETEETITEHDIEFWQQQARENLELAMRKQAELENYRKLVAKDMDYARRSGVERLLGDLFPALDGLAQALQGYKDTPDGENPLLDGLRRTARALEVALARHGIEKINQSGVPFDSELHQPLSVEDNSEVSEETVGEVYVEGYRLGPTVLKPAMVKVLKPA